MKKKAKVTSSLHPLHFEDLEPHRFEDLVRQLIYDFRDWQDIEATGRSGSDEGFDIRGWEKVNEMTNNNEEGEEEDGSPPIDGNLWMIQCKREKNIGPSRIKKIINECISKDKPPYGYILVAPANFSKKSFDVFREELRKKGVLEFHLWGRSSLEDMLSMPKNDHILFTFFGFSLIVKKRSKTSEIKFAVNNKNKLFRILGRHNIFQPILLRDYNDINYPFKSKYKDFDEFPRWEEYMAFQYHPYGLCVHDYGYYAYIDRDKKEFDFTEVVNLVHRPNKENSNSEIENNAKVLDFWQYLPRERQAKLTIDNLIAYDDMLLIDQNGDDIYDFPHLFLDFNYPKGPFRGVSTSLVYENEQVNFNKEEYKRIEIFPKTFPEVKKGQVYDDKTIDWATTNFSRFERGSIQDLVDINNKYGFLNIGDLILVPDSINGESKVYLKVTYKYSKKFKDYLHAHPHFRFKEDLERQLGRKVEDNENLDIFEYVKVYDFQIKHYMK